MRLEKPVRPVGPTLGFRTSPVDLAPGDLPAVMLRNGRFLKVGRRYELHVAVDLDADIESNEGAALAAEIEFVRHLAKTFAAEPSIPPEDLRHRVLRSRWKIAPGLDAFFATEDEFLEQEGLPRDIVGDPGRPIDYAPWQALHESIRDVWPDGLIVMPSAALHGAATILVPGRLLMTGAVALEGDGEPIILSDNAIEKALTLRTAWDERNRAGR